ncbi:hypothetical protein F01_80004 [Burkholderia cenocepacia]|nr:hypothetical protein F01_80004 [Burkholderia cenocepacia]
MKTAPGLQWRPTYTAGTPLTTIQTKWLLCNPSLHSRNHAHRAEP